MRELLSGWSNTKFGELGEIRLGKMLDKAKNRGVPVQYLRNINVRWFGFDLSDLQTLLLSEEERDALTVRDGDLLICEGGEPGRCAVWRGGASKLTFQKALHRMRVAHGVVPELLMYRLRADAESGRLRDAFTGTTIKHLTGESLDRYEIDLPPANEQTRITTKIAEVLAQVDACRERLDRVPALLKKFREAVLEAAVSGRLTEEWRVDHCRDEADWSDTNLEQIVSQSANGLSKRRGESGTATTVLRLADFKAANRVVGGERQIRLEPKELAKYTLNKEDLLVVRVNGSRELAGKFIVYAAHDQSPEAYCDHFIRLRLNGQRICAHFAQFIANSGSGRRYIEGELVTSAGQNTINQTALFGLPLRLPPVDEQSEIVRRVGELFALADGLERKYRAAVTRVERLTPSVLAKAFRGELVPQNAADEPADKLLERIRAARASDDRSGLAGRSPGRGARSGARGRVAVKTGSAVKRKSPGGRRSRASSE